MKIAALLVAVPLIGFAQEGTEPTSAPQYAPQEQYAPPPQYAPPQQQPAGYAPQARYAQRQHSGLFLRPDLGAGFVTMKTDYMGVTWDLSGPGGTFGLALGGSNGNFAIALHVWDVVAASPQLTLSSGGSSITLPTTSDVSAGMVGFGVLLNWYLMPSNFYVAITPSVTRLVITNGSGSSGNSEFGFGVRGAIGKEWWVTNNWGFGLSGSLGFSANKDSSDPGAPTWTSFGLGLSASATYN